VKTVEIVFQEHGIPHDLPVTYVQKPAMGRRACRCDFVRCMRSEMIVSGNKEDGSPIASWQRKGSRFHIAECTGISDDSSSLQLSRRLSACLKMLTGYS
jgi:hypothetical protein